MYKLPTKKLEQIKNAIHQAIENLSTPPIAAFDADGTLWATDMGESFFKYQLSNNFINGLPKDPWLHYKKMHKENPRAAYLWLAQINAGKSLKDVRECAQRCLLNHPNLELFSGQKEIIKYLQSLGAKIYIVTASIKWAVEPAAALYDIPYENVIGVQTRVENDLVTTEQLGPITWREGKPEGLLQATNGIKPFFAAGNTPGDLSLLECSTHIRFALNSASPEHPLYKSEKKLQDIAKEKGWFFHSFNMTE